MSYFLNKSSSVIAVLERYGVKKIKITDLIGLVGIFLSVILLIFFYFSQSPNLNEPSRIKELEISSGMGFDEIADKLKTKDFIYSKQIFKIYSLLSGNSRQFKPGTFLLNSTLSIPELVKILTNGPTEVSAIIVPGMTLKEIDEKLSSLSIIKAGSLKNFDFASIKTNYPWLAKAQSLEGFLLPDTYYFFLDSDTSLVVQKFLNNFQSKALPFFKNNGNLLEDLTLASLLEKEVPDYSEQKIAAGILVKRLKVGMPLQVDASLIYIKCFGRFLNCPQLSNADYKIDSPYNTYLYNNLPPGPICNPNLETIKSALNPQQSEYWYYLSDPKTQKTIFSKTLDEHRQNRAKYLLNK